MSIVIYIRGQGNSLEWPWYFAHPRKRRVGTDLYYFDYEDLELREYKDWNGSLPPKSAPNGVSSIAGILDLYSFIGHQRAGAIEELHFFTHGWSGGPVLRNTYDDFATATDRDPNDMDPRIYDFRLTAVLGGAARGDFAKAFSRSALVKLWGCNHEEEHRQFIKLKFFGATTDAERNAAKNEYRFHIREGTYPYALAMAIRLPVYAAPLGWGTSPFLPFGIEGGAAVRTKAKRRGIFPPAKGDMWWRVSPFFRPERGDQFYRRELKARTDILDYVAYTESMARHVP